MALPLSPNLSLDIYRAANVSSPYTFGALSSSLNKAFLKPAVTNGRFGTALYLKWTHIAFLQPGVDIRDAYNSQLDPSRNNALADLIVATDSTTPATKTAYYVVYVEVISRNTGLQHLRAYLDRFQPSAWPTDSI
jgi:hypothetical protein